MIPMSQGSLGVMGPATAAVSEDRDPAQRSNSRLHHYLSQLIQGRGGFGGKRGK